MTAMYPQVTTKGGEGANVGNSLGGESLQDEAQLYPFWAGEAKKAVEGGIGEWGRECTALTTVGVSSAESGSSGYRGELSSLSSGDSVVDCFSSAGTFSSEGISVWPLAGWCPFGAVSRSEVSLSA